VWHDGYIEICIIPHYGLIFIFHKKLIGLNRSFVRLSTVCSEIYAGEWKNKLLFIAFMADSVLKSKSLSRHHTGVGERAEKFSILINNINNNIALSS
jgi:hypothetical protein